MTTKGINSPEKLKERSDKMKGRVLHNITDSERKKLSESVTLLWQDSEYRGRVLQNRSKALSEGRGKRSIDELIKLSIKASKNVYQYDENLILVKIWDSLQNVKAYYGKTIIRRWQNKHLDRNTKMHGFFWKSVQI